MAPTLYDVLEVSRAASPETIRAAYKSLMQRHHPDRATGAGSDEQAKRINAAYQILSDPQQRAAYDAQLKAQAVVAPARPVAPPRRAPTLTAAQIEALLKPRRSNLRLKLALLCVAAIAAVFAWKLLRPPPRLLVVGSAPFAQSAEPFEVLIDTTSIRRIGDQAHLLMLFRPADGKAVEMAGAKVLGGTQVVAYDCARRSFTSWQRRLSLADGGSVPLPDAYGQVSPDSAHDVAMEHACAPWWRK